MTEPTLSDPDPAVFLAELAATLVCGARAWAGGGSPWFPLVIAAASLGLALVEASAWLARWEARRDPAPGGEPQRRHRVARSAR